MRWVLALALGMSACAGGAVDRRAPAPVAPPPSKPAHAEIAVATPPPPPSKPPPKELPRGGRTIFPEHRLVGYCGTPGAPNLGKLDGNLEKRAKEIEDYGAKYAAGRKVLPVFELIAVVVQGAPGKDGMWRRRLDDSVVDHYLAAARAAKAILLLDIQPGQSDFMSEVRYFDKYLKEPDVGVALDPEWAVKAKETPGKVYGHTTGDVIDQVATYLADVVAKNELPEKVLVFHQLAPFIVSKEDAIKAHAGITIVKSADGLGGKPWKLISYGALTKKLPDVVHPGFKLFFQEDVARGYPMMKPDEVLGLKPQPEYILYE